MKAKIQDADLVTELAALARLITFAHQSANDMGVELPRYCLDMALIAVSRELEILGVEVNYLDSPETDQQPRIH